MNEMCVCGGGRWKGANYFLRELALSRRVAVYHTCHGQEIIACMFGMF